jgi:hypothetical protein
MDDSDKDARLAGAAQETGLPFATRVLIAYLASDRPTT